MQATISTPPQEIDWTALRPKVTQELLQEITQRIVQSFHPSQVILFGSYAYGTPNRESDIDLLVIMDSSETMPQRIGRVREVARVRFLPMDVIIYTPAEVQKRIEMGDFFVKEILEKGRVLYQNDTNGRVGGKSGSGL